MYLVKYKFTVAIMISKRTDQSAFHYVFVSFLHFTKFGQQKLLEPTFSRN